MSLRRMLGYNIDKITVWEEIEGLKDEDGIPTKIWKKNIFNGRWENSIKIIRNMAGDSISSTANVIIPILLDVKKNILIENGESEEEKPSIEARKIMTMEEITRIGKPSLEWIYYV